jgi:hypothetical protein
MLGPAIIAPGEWNVLLSPLHPQCSLKWAVSGSGPALRSMFEITDGETESTTELYFGPHRS